MTNDKLIKEIESKTVNFDSLDLLNKGIIESLTSLGLKQTRGFQSFAINEILGQEDFLLQAPTGSGKSLCYIIPCIIKILEEMSANDDFTGNLDYNLSFHNIQCIKAMIIVPSKELAVQIYKLFQKLCENTNNLVIPFFLDSTPKTLTELNRNLKGNILITYPQILISIGKIYFNTLNNSSNQDIIVIFQNVKYITIDEADLMFSVYGYEKELKKIFQPNTNDWDHMNVKFFDIHNIVTKRTQVVLVSATLCSDIEILNKLCLYNPKLLIVYDDTTDLVRTDQFIDNFNTHSIIYKCKLAEDENKKIIYKFLNVDRKKNQDFLAVYGIIKNSLFSDAQNKTRMLIFVDNIKNVIRLGVVLKELKINVGCIHEKMELNERIEMLKRFNIGVINVLVASDSDSLNIYETPNKKFKKDSNSILSRGLNFSKISCLIIFYGVESVDQFIHKVGRCRHTKNNKKPAVCLYFDSSSDNQHQIFNEIREKYEFEKVVEFDFECFSKYAYRVINCVKLASKNKIKTLINKDN